MSTEKMREEFEAAYVEGLVARCGEGFRSTAEYSLEQRRPDGEYLNYPDFIAWWAWQASRAAIEVELPDPRDTLVGPTLYAQFKASVEGAGLKVKA